MFHPLPIFVGLRYVRTRRQGFFVSFISWVSMLGVCVGVAALITIISVMNGFERELRSRILSVTSHATLSAFGAGLQDWPALRKLEYVDALMRELDSFVAVRNAFPD